MLLGILIHIPMANSHVFAGRENVALFGIIRVPSQAIALLCLTSQGDVRLAAVVAVLRPVWVLCAVKDVHFARDCLRGDQIWILGHVSRSVDFAVVIDRLSNLDARADIAVRTNL